MNGAAKKLIWFIETPETDSAEREKAISELNLIGIDSTEIEHESYAFWLSYFEKNMSEVLQKRIVLISHLLPDEIFKQCFDIAFQEFQERKKQLGIDIRKYWAP